MSLSNAEAEILVRDVLRQHGKLSANAASIAPEADLYGLGLSSLATVNVMLEIETRLDASLPETALTRETFRSILALSRIVASLDNGTGA